MTNEILKDEILKEEQLNQVSGGGPRQIVGDNQFLKGLGLSHYDGTYGWDLAPGQCREAIINGWAQVGVFADPGYTFDNVYRTSLGEPISRKEAFRIALRHQGFSQSDIDRFDFEQFAGTF